jgi:hypothetical protein
MKIRSMALVLLVALGVLVACHGASNYVPQGTSLNGSTPSLDASRPSDVPATVVTQLCAKVPPSKVPGKYIVMVVFGDLSKSKFTGQGSWFSYAYKLGNPTTPTPGPTAKPGKIAAWLYYGSYSLKTSKQTGCVFFYASKNGKPIVKTMSGKSDNAFSVGEVLVKAKHWHTANMTTPGILTETIALSSATSGGGTATLKTDSGQPYDTANITLVGRIATKIGTSP